MRAAVCSGVRCRSYLEDTATNEALAVTKVRKLVTQDKVDVVLGGITSSMRNAIKDTIVNRGKTLYIYPQLYEGKECTPYLFCTGPTPAQQCDTFIPWLIKNGGKKFYLPSADYVWPHVLNEYARKTIEKNGGEVVGEEYFPGRSQRVQRHREQDHVEQGERGVQHHHSARAWRLSSSSSTKPASTRTAGAWLVCTTTRTRSTSRRHNEIEGLASCLDYFKAVNDPGGNKIQAEYNKLYPGNNPFTAGSAATGMYRGLKLWEAAVKEAKSVKREDVAKALDHAKIADGPGGGCELVPGTRHVKMNMYTAVAKNGKFEIVEKSKGPVMPGECG